MVRLTGTKVAVTPIYDPDKTSSGLWIPDHAKERVDQGIVKYVGSEVEGVKIGDYVLFSGWTGTLVNLEGEGQLIILPEEFITCMVEAPDSDIPGLYFRDREGNYFTATYEMTMHLIADAFQNQDWRHGLTAVARKIRGSQIHELPTVADHKKWR